MLADSDDNLIEENDFSHTSNTCLSLFTACRNRFLKNNLSWGIRIKPGETHARDSACVLVQAGSDDNYFADNDITHGGDGVFLRPLPAGPAAATSSSGTTPRMPTTIASRPNAPATPTATTRPTTAATASGWAGRTRRSSRTTRPATTACPAGFHNAPWGFKYVPDGPQSGAAGIIMAGMCDHTICRGNKFIGNNGCGICLFGDDSPEHKFTAFHWVLENNVIKRQSLGNLHGVRRLDRHGGQRAGEQPRRQHHQGRHEHEHLRAPRRSANHPAARGQAGGADGREAGPAGARQAGPAGGVRRLGQQRPRRQPAHVPLGLQRRDDGQRAPRDARLQQDRPAQRRPDGQQRPLLGPRLPRLPRLRGRCRSSAPRARPASGVGPKSCPRGAARANRKSSRPRTGGARRQPDHQAQLQRRPRDPPGGQFLAGLQVAALRQSHQHPLSRARRTPASRWRARPSWSSGSR